MFALPVVPAECALLKLMRIALAPATKLYQISSSLKLVQDGSGADLVAPTVLAWMVLAQVLSPDCGVTGMALLHSSLGAGATFSMVTSSDTVLPPARVDQSRR